MEPAAQLSKIPKDITQLADNLSTLSISSFGNVYTPVVQLSITTPPCLTGWSLQAGLALGRSVRLDLALYHQL